MPSAAAAAGAATAAAATCPPPPAADLRPLTITSKQAWKERRQNTAWSYTLFLKKWRR